MKNTETFETIIIPFIQKNGNSFEEQKKKQEKFESSYALVASIINELCDDNLSSS